MFRTPYGQIVALSIPGWPTVRTLFVNPSPLERSRPRGGRYAWAMTDR